MDDKKISYSSQIYNSGKAFLYAAPVYILLIIAVIGIGVYLRRPSIGVIGWVIISSVPFLFQKRFRYIFTRRLELEFDDQAFSIKEYKITDNTFIKEITVNWAAIKSYKCYFSTSDVTYLAIYLRNGSSKSFSFKDEKNQEQAISEKSAFSILYYFIKQYNLGKQSEEGISFKPAFLTTKLGAFVLYSVITLAIAGIVVHVILQPKTSMFSFISLFIILGLVMKRKTDMAFSNKISQLEPRLPVD
jgi:hypothetical protein